MSEPIVFLWRTGPSSWDARLQAIEPRTGRVLDGSGFEITINYAQDEQDAIAQASLYFRESNVFVQKHPSDARIEVA